MDPPYSDPWEWNNEEPDLPDPFLELLNIHLDILIDDGDPPEVLSDLLFEELAMIELNTVNFSPIIYVIPSRIA